VFEQAFLSEKFRHLLDKHQEAVKAYTALMKQVEDPGLRQQVGQLCRDKTRHVRLAERLVEIVP